MIIEAGYDVLTLMDPAVRENEESRQALWVLCMDKHLRMLRLDKACEVMGSNIEEHVDDIAAVLAREPGVTKYYAIAHWAPEVWPGPEEGLYGVDKKLRLMPALSDAYLLGRAVFDPTGYYSSVPRYSFRDYPLLDHLPRAASFEGPHPLCECTCAACEQHERMLAENRERHESSSDAPSD